MRYEVDIRNGDLRNLYTRLKEQGERKQDLVVPSTALQMEGGLMTVQNVPSIDRMKTTLGELGVDMSDDGDRRLFGYSGTRTAHEQISSRLKIPRRYYRRMLMEGEEGRKLLDRNVNHWLNERSEDNFFLRTLRPSGSGQLGRMRAFLSQNYRVIDNLDVLTGVLKAIKDAGMGDTIEVESADLTENQMYVRFVAPNVKADATDMLRNYESPNGGVGNAVMTGFVLRNSEVGKGAFEIVPRIVVLACSNGMMIRKDANRKIHLGSRLSKGIVQWSEKTRRNNMRAIISKAQDTVRTFLSPRYLNRVIEEWSEKGSREIEHPENAVDNVAAELSLTEEERDDVFRYFWESGDKTANGIAQAVTYHAHEVEDPDKQYALEGSAMDVLDNMDQFDVRKN